MSLPAISKHLKVLERAGLIARGRDAQRRPCRLESGRLEEIDAWLAGYRRFWERSYARLDDYLVEMQRNELEIKNVLEVKNESKKEKKHDRKKP
jgi:DNA-binding MarR family transcriptional regulator